MSGAAAAVLVLAVAIVVVFRQAPPSRAPSPPPPVPTPPSPPIVRLDEVRARLSENDLGGARRALERIPAPGDAETERLRADLVAHERRRDEALRVALECQETDAFPCVRTNALEALAIDRTSVKANEIVSTLENLGFVAEEVTPRLPPEVARRGCQRLVDDGRRALETERYDRAIDYANDALAMLALCPGADELKREVTLARNASQQGRGRP